VDFAELRGGVIFFEKIAFGAVNRGAFRHLD
jgi:hypothetical protein